MLQAIQFLKKRPNDRTIRLIEVGFGLIYIATTYYNLIHQGDAIEQTFFWKNVGESALLYIKYGIIALGLFPLIRGITGKDFLKSKYFRIAQIMYGIILIYVSSKIVESASLEIDTLIFLFGFGSIIAGITGKMVSKTGLKYGEKITKIRV